MDARLHIGPCIRTITARLRLLPNAQDTDTADAMTDELRGLRQVLVAMVQDPSIPDAKVAEVCDEVRASLKGSHAAFRRLCPAKRRAPGGGEAQAVEVETIESTATVGDLGGE